MNQIPHSWQAKQRDQVQAVYKALHFLYRPQILSWLRTKKGPAWFKSVLNYFLKQSLLQQLQFMLLAWSQQHVCLGQPRAVSVPRRQTQTTQGECSNSDSLSSKRTAAFIKLAAPNQFYSHSVQESEKQQDSSHCQYLRGYILVLWTACLPPTRIL